MGWFWADENQKPVVNTGAACPVKGPEEIEAKCPVKPKEAESKCPVKHNDNPPPAQCPVKKKDPNTQGSWFAGWFGKQEEDGESDVINPLNNMPDLSSKKIPGQRIYLPTQRTQSSIPRGEKETEGVWEYPSPQQMYNAMVRKSGTADDIPEDAVESMVDVHNFLNEGAWQEILKWEEPYIQEAKRNPRLLKFTGRPDDMSPRATVLQWLGKVYPAKYGTPPPFDRHDWTVLRPEPDSEEWKQVRYVIDYYAGPDDDDGMPTFMLDVRPALDSVSAAVARFHAATGSTWDKAMGRTAK